MDSPPPSRMRRFLFRLLRWMFLGIALVAILFSLYLWFVLSWSYSKGERAGYVQKFSNKGWVVKTWEGELAMVAVPGSTPEKFYFSVRSDSIATQINASLGHQVALSYEQHVGIPSSVFGETEYFVVGIRVIE